MIQACTTEWGEAARILVVDDDDAVRRVTTRILARHGFEVFDAPSGESALEIFRSQNDLVSAVVLDWSMPGMSSADVISELWIAREDLPIIVLTGWSSVIQDEIPRGSQPVPVLQKPYDPAELVALLRVPDRSS